MDEEKLKELETLPPAQPIAEGTDLFSIIEDFGK